MQHQREECPERLCRCTLGCTSVVKRKDMPAHVANVCLKRVVECPYVLHIHAAWAGARPDGHMSTRCLRPDLTFPLRAQVRVWSVHA